MQISIITSSLLHIGFIVLTILGLPIFNSPVIDIPPVVQVEILEITEQTNVPEAHPIRHQQHLWANIRASTVDKGGTSRAPYRKCQGHKEHVQSPA